MCSSVQEFSLGWKHIFLGSNHSSGLFFMSTHDDKAGLEKSNSSESSFLGPESESKTNSLFQDNRPEALVQRKMQEAANSSPQVEEAMQLQQVANAYTTTSAPIQREVTDSESEEVSGMSVESAPLESGSHGVPSDSGGGSGGSSVAAESVGPDPELGADVESLSWFRSTYTSSLEMYEKAQQDAKTFDLVLKAIHREYGNWFANSNQGSEEERAAKQEDFKALEAALISGGNPGKFWCVVDGLEEGRGDMMVKLAGLRADFNGVMSHFQSALSAMTESPSSANMEYAGKLWEHARELSGQIIDERSGTLLLRTQAEGLLEQGRTKFGGGVVTAPVVIDKDEIAAARAAQGKGDQPLSLHQDDGPGYAMEALKSAMVEYVLATRAKEELRTELGVQKLKKVSKSAKKADATIEPRIAEVRKRKDVAEARYKAIRKSVQALLDDGIPSAIEAEIAEMDRTYLGLSREEAAEHGTAMREDRAEKSGTAKKIGKVTDQLVISEANYARLRRSIEPLAAAGVGAKTFGIDVGVNFSFGVGKGSEIKVGGGIKYSGSTNLQDDRKLRVSHSFGVYGKGSADLAGVVGASAGAELMKGKTEVFMDADHWASVMAYRFSAISKDIANLDDTQKFVGDTLDPEQSEQVLATSRLAEDGTTKVDSTAVSGSLGASALGMGVSGSYEKKWMTFSKEGQDTKKQAKQTTKSVSISPGSNINVSVTRTIIDGHANPDNDGKYWNIKLDLSGSASASFTSYTSEAPDTVYGGWEQGMREKMGMDPTPSSGGGDGGFGFAEESLVSDASSAESEGHFGGIVKAISDYLGAEVATIEGKMKSVVDLSVGLSGSGSFAVEWNYVYSDANEGNELQYRRTSAGKGMGLSVSAPVGTVGPASVGLDLGVSRGSSGMLSEKLGDGTLTYLQTVFNGLHPRDVRNARVGRATASEWETYIEGHDKEVWVALCKIGSQTGGAYAELNAAISSSGSVPAPRDGMSEEQLADLSAKTASTHDAAVALKEGTAAQVGLEDIGAIDAAKFAVLKPLLTAYFNHQGALDKANTALDWA